MPKYFFTATESAHAQMSGVFDFVWPTAAAMWNLRWQVSGYLHVVPGATVEQLQARFTEGSDIAGANFRRACFEHTWDQQKESFAGVLLVNSIASFEGWLDQVLEELGKNTKTLKKALQFPNSTAIKEKGAAWAIEEITHVESVELKSAFYQPLCRGRHYSLAKLDAMLLCYRFFKELRNCSMHGGGTADQHLMDAYRDFAAVSTTALLGVSEVPEHSAPAIKTQTRLSLRGVVGFTNILLKIIATMDAELSRSKHSEKHFVRKWKTANPHMRMLSSDKWKRARQIKGLAKNAGFPEPSDANSLGDWLSTLGLTNF